MVPHPSPDPVASRLVDCVGPLARPPASSARSLGALAPAAPLSLPGDFSASHPRTHPPPPPPCSVGPNFSHHKARVQAVGWFPLGTRKQGSRTFAAPTPPPQQKWGRTKSRPSTPPPPQHALAPSLQAHGDRGPSGSGRRATSMLGSGTHMVTQQVVLLSHTSEQVDPSTTLPPPPPPSLRPRREGCTESAPSGPKKWRL